MPAYDPTTDPGPSGRPGRPRLAGTTGYLLAGFLVSMLALSLLSATFFAGVGMIVLVIGLPVVFAAMMLARGFGNLQLAMLRWTGLDPVQPPQWPAPVPGTPLLTRLLSPLRSAHSWSYLLHQLLINPIVSIVTFALTVTWWAGAAGGLTFWVWQGFLPDKPPEADWPGWIAAQLPLLAGWSSRLVETLLYGGFGLLLAVTLPAGIGALGRLHHGLARAMLGRWVSDELASRVEAEASARRSAVHAEDTAMRRLERDLHDGPQQRLVRLQMDLAAAERRAEAGDADQAAAYAREAQLQAKAALEELRALSRGVAPPLLADRGLTAALAALAEDSPLPVRSRLDPDLDQVNPDLARATYFIAAELLTNVAKHAGADGAELDCAVHWDDPPRLVLTVSDDGRGGARVSEGHGLAGLRERIDGLRGRLSVDSPAGGPTTVVAVLPLVWSLHGAEDAIVSR